ncbi:MAG: hypothetical protein JXR97_09110 [Planctomycetes bacterium]|nr:hypothetical protein [Planctomycetota bacterium]
MGKSFLLTISACLCFLCSSSALPGEEKPALKRVFILHSYEAEHVCGKPQHDGVVKALEEEGFKDGEQIVIDAYHMDTKRKNNTPELINKEAEIAIKKIEAFKPDILVTLDDNAFRTVALKLKSPIPTVFCGLNGQPEMYNKTYKFMDTREKPGGHITGVYEKLHYVDALRVHKNIFPGLKKTRAFVDESPTGKAIHTQMILEINNEGKKVPCKSEIVVVKSWEEYQNKILETSLDDEIGLIYPAALLLKDKDGKTYTAPQIFKWTVEHSTKPEIALNYAFAKLGLFGGAAVDFFAMGKQAGKIAARILKGEKPGDISIEEAKRYALAFNLKRVRQLGLEIPQDILLAADNIY